MARTTDWRTLDTIVDRLNDANLPWDQIDATLQDKNDQLALYGVESITYQCDVLPSILYLNTGDSYTVTICYDTDAREFVSASWGALLEAHENTCEDCQATWDEDEGTDGEDE